MKDLYRPRSKVRMDSDGIEDVVEMTNLISESTVVDVRSSGDYVTLELVDPYDNRVYYADLPLQTCKCSNPRVVGPDGAVWIS